MTRLLPIRRAAPCLMLMLAGCATGDSARFPSLLPRAIESRSEAEPVVTAAPVVADPALDQQIVALGKNLRENAASFATTAARAGTAATAARGDAVGSERWITAQAALAELDGYRATTSATVTDIEQLALSRAAAGLPDYPTLEILRAEAQTALDDQAARIGAIQASLPAA